MSQILRPPRRHAPTVELTENGQVRKTYTDCPFWLKNSVGRLAVNRECWALERLRESTHAPRLLSRPDPFTVVTEYIEGRALETLTRDDVDPRRLHSQALSLLNDLATSGVVHADLGHDHWQSMGRECNLIWTSDDTLVAIDFAGSVPIHSRFSLMNRLGALLHRHDQLLLAKLAFHFGEKCPVGKFPQTDWHQGTWELLRALGKL